MLVISRGIIFSNTVYILYHVHEIIDSEEEEEEEEEDTSEGSRKLHEWRIKQTRIFTGVWSISHLPSSSSR